jgi:hypothetical protein
MSYKGEIPVFVMGKNSAAGGVEQVSWISLF